MVENPERYITPLKEAGANMFNFHIEAASEFPTILSPLEDPKDIIKRVREAGMLCSITIKPKTPVSAIAELIPLLLMSLHWLINSDMVLVMTVDGGLPGEGF